MFSILDLIRLLNTFLDDKINLDYYTDHPHNIEYYAEIYITLLDIVREIQLSEQSVTQELVTEKTISKRMHSDSHHKNAKKPLTGLLAILESNKARNLQYHCEVLKKLKEITLTT